MVGNMQWLRGGVVPGASVFLFKVEMRPETTFVFVLWIWILECEEFFTGCVAIKYYPS